MIRRTRTTFAALAAAAAAASLALSGSAQVSAFSVTTTATTTSPTTTPAGLLLLQQRPSNSVALHMASILSSSDGAQESSTALKSSTVADIDLVEPSSIKSPSWTDDDFVFGLEGSGLERPIGRTANVVVEGDYLETQPHQLAAVGGTFLSHATFAAFAIGAMLHANGDNVALTVAQVAALTVTSWAAADFGSGVLHWSVDNYGNGRTPIMGGIIAAFQGHHSAPWTITQREFCNNVHKLCIPFGIAPVALAAAATHFDNPALVYFLTVFCSLEIMSQEFHKWSHQLPSETPSWVNTLQKVGVTIGRRPHAQHHLAPYKGNYCIVSGFCNNVLDDSGFFRRLEHVIYDLNGVEPNAWKLDADLKAQTLAGDYSLPQGAKQKRR